MLRIKLVVPGFIDAHVHIIGGGGEGGFKTRTPELTLTSLTTAGITTVIGFLEQMGRHGEWKVCSQKRGD